MNECFIPPAPLDTAVLFLVFNRIETTKEVFEAIRKAKPPRLYVAADGPRMNRKGESEVVEQVRKIASDVDWPCELKTLYRQDNLGCKYACSEAITWFFEQEEKGIILEDDCLPSQSFFWFCEDNLKKYMNNKDVWHISGAVIRENSTSPYTYHFSAYPGMWGWATWANRWASYRVSLRNADLDTLLRIAKKNYDISISYWSKAFNGIRLEEIDTWDYQWVFALWLNGGLSITPNKNMISNIGFGSGATHTKDPDSKLSYMPRKEILNINHPVLIKIDKKSDGWLKRKHFSNGFLLIRVLRRLARVLRRLFKK